MTICKRVYYSGRVQGVGFRYTARSLAQHHAVTGFVRNLPDGRVELVAEGDPAAVDRFLDAVSRHMGDNIEERIIHDEPTQGFADFVIQR